MLGCECLIYGVHVLLWSVPVCVLLSLALQKMLERSVYAPDFVVPWAVLPAALGAFVVVGLATVYAVRKVDAGSPVEALRSELA